MDDVIEENNSDSRPESEASKKENEHHEKAAKKSDDEEEEGESGSEIFEVDQILDTKMSGRKRIFLVSWKGFPASENSWEPEDNLGGASEAVKTFMEKYNEKVKKPQGKRKSTSVESRVKSSTPSSSTRKPNYREDSDESEHDEAKSKDSDDDDEFVAPKKKRGRLANTRKSTSKATKKEAKLSSNYRTDSDESEHDEAKSEDSNDDDEFAPKKKRGRPSNTSKSTPKATKNEAKSSTSDASISRRMNQNLRWLEDDSDSDESNAAADENGEKKKNRSSEEKGGKAKSNTPPLPDTKNETTESKSNPPITLKLSIKDVGERKDGKKAKKEKTEKPVDEKPPPATLELSEPTTSTSNHDEVKILGIEQPKNSPNLRVIVEEKNKRKSVTVEYAISVNAAGLALVALNKLQNIYNQFD
uniref:Chromo domain-containing protein n=1 Tax=Acrobeloides nanus TaxID=290746 RepID=A0A914BV77_9BILA